MKRESLTRISAVLSLAVVAVGCRQEGQSAGRENAPTPAIGGADSKAAPSLNNPPGPAAAPAAPRLAEPTRLGESATTPSGLKYETLQEGDGAQAKTGDRVSIHYAGRFEDGRTFDSSRDRGEPWTFEVGSRLAVQGFNEGVVGMKVGERRRLTVPSQIGYGALGTFAEAAPGVPEDTTGSMQSGRRPEIPPNTTLVYEVELLGIERPEAASSP
jgi:FKBP-type peptidyl-prolyl cis-trans isomerase